MGFIIFLMAMAAVHGILFFSHIGMRLFDEETRRIWSIWNWIYTLGFGIAFVGCLIALAQQP